MKSLLRESVWMAALVAALLAASVIAYFVLPMIVVSKQDFAQHVPAPIGARAAPAPSSTDLIAQRNSARVAGVALIAGIGAALATGFAARTFYLSRRTRSDDRYKTALTQLSASKMVAQVSAIGELRSLAEEVPQMHRQVFEVLAAYVRTTATTEHPAPSSAAIQAAMTAIAGRTTRRDRGLALDFTGADLRGVRIPDAPLRSAVFDGAQLAGASLVKADLRRASFLNARAESVLLQHADLRGAQFRGADLKSATFDGSDARGADFEDAELARASVANARGFPSRMH